MVREESWGRLEFGVFYRRIRCGTHERRVTSERKMSVSKWVRALWQEKFLVLPYSVLSTVIEEQ